MTKKVIIIGATSGIGKALVEVYAQKGYEIGITGRRVNLLEEISNSMPKTIFHIQKMDVAETEISRNQMAALVEKMGEIDTIIINAGVGFPKATYEQELQTIDINVRGFMALAEWSYSYFKSIGGGKLSGISSVAATRSSPHAPEYHASKAFMSSYMEGLRLRSKKWNPTVSVTDIRPGFVDTAMTKSNKGMFWVATPERAAEQIFAAIESKKNVQYVTKRYWLIGTLLKALPEWLLAKVM